MFAKTGFNTCGKHNKGDDEKFANFIGWLNTHRDVWENARDFHGRTLLHSAAENGNLPLVKTLVCAGVNINAKEKMCCNCTYHSSH